MTFGRNSGNEKAPQVESLGKRIARAISRNRWALVCGLLGVGLAVAIAPNIFLAVFFAAVLGGTSFIPGAILDEHRNYYKDREAEDREWAAKTRKK